MVLSRTAWEFPSTIYCFGYFLDTGITIVHGICYRLSRSINRCMGITSSLWSFKYLVQKQAGGLAWKKQIKVALFQLQRAMLFSAKCNKPKTFVRIVNSLSKYNSIKAICILSELRDQLDTFYRKGPGDFISEWSIEYAKENVEEKKDNIVKTDKGVVSNSMLSLKDF